MRQTRLTLILGAMAFSIGCDRAPTPKVAPTPSAPTPAATASDEAAVMDWLTKDKQGTPSGGGTGALPAGHPPLNAGGEPPSAGALPPPVPSGAQLSFEAPAGWTSEPPANAMRSAQFKIAPVEGDTDPAEVVVYSGIGGSAMANITRWKDQFRTAGGEPVPESDCKLESFDVAGMKVTMIEVVGVYTNSMAPSAAGRESQHDSRLLGAVIEAPGGNWFVKATGPDATMKAHRSAISDFILSVQPQE